MEKNYALKESDKMGAFTGKGSSNLKETKKTNALAR